MTASTPHPDGRRGTTPQFFDIPVAVPAGSGAVRASALARGESRESRETNTPGLSSPSSAPRRGPGGRVGARQLARFRDSLSERDWLVIHRIAEHRYLTSAQAEGFVFTGHASQESGARVCRRVLARLHHEGLIRPLARRVGGVRAGSSATVWQLAPAGFRLLSDHAEGLRTYEPSPRFLGHCLAVADAHLVARSLTGLGDIQHVSVQVEPLSWRRYTGIGGENRWLQPDLYLEITGSDKEGAFEDRSFVEIDMGTESLTTLIGKCEQYEVYRRAGTEQGGQRAFPRVLWFMHGERGPERADRLVQAIRRRSGLIPGMFTVCLPEGLSDVLGGATGERV